MSVFFVGTRHFCYNWTYVLNAAVCLNYTAYCYNIMWIYIVMHFLLLNLIELKLLTNLHFVNVTNYNFYVSKFFTLCEKLSNIHFEFCFQFQWHILVRTYVILRKERLWAWASVCDCDSISNFDLHISNKKKH